MKMAWKPRKSDNHVKSWCDGQKTVGGIGISIIKNPPYCIKWSSFMYQASFSSIYNFLQFLMGVSIFKKKSESLFLNPLYSVWFLHLKFLLDLSKTEKNCILDLAILNMAILQNPDVGIEQNWCLMRKCLQKKVKINHQTFCKMKKSLILLAIVIK